jgi:putative ABC transport system permease protein
MDAVRQDLRYAGRMLLKAPGFSLVVIVVLALGIGASTAIFSVVHAVLLRPLPYDDPDRLVLIRETLRDRFGGVTAPNFVDWREQNQVFAEMAARQRATFTLTGRDQPERVSGARVTHRYFPMLGVAPVLGRSFLPEEDRPGAPPVALLSEALWRSRFAADTGVVGGAIRLDGRAHTVVGIAPAGVEIPGGVEELWVPLSIGPDDLAATGSHTLSVVARLKPGVELEQARSDMKSIARRLEAVRPHSNQGWSVDVSPLHERVVAGARTGLVLLLAAVAFVVLIACANVANLLLARAGQRRQEMAVRAAIGASRLRLVRQLLVESVLLGVLGGAAGLLVAYWGTDGLVALLPSGLPRASQVRIDGWVLGFALALSMAAGVLFGLAPALHTSSSRGALTESLRQAGRVSGPGAERLKGLLMVAEVALALLLLVGAGLLGRSYLRLQGVEPGIDPENVLALQLALPASRYGEPEQVSRFYGDLLEKVAALPGVDAAAATSHLPLGAGGFNLAVFVEGAAPAPPSGVPTAYYRAVTANYFQALGVRLLRGRPFGERDRLGAPRVAIVNATMARLIWPGQEPLGRRFTLDDNETAPIEVVGVASDVHHFGLDREPQAELHVPYLQATGTYWSWTNRSLTLVVRGSTPAPALAAAVRRAVASVDKDLPVYGIRTMSEVLAASVVARRASTTLLGLFAAAALLLASVGLYGVVSYSVGRRTHELGLRMALGARAGDVQRLVLARGLRLALLGLAVGFAGALALSRLLSDLVFGISTLDPATLAAVGGLLLAVSLLACYLPARRATRIDPAAALRFE